MCGPELGNLIQQEFPACEGGGEGRSCEAEQAQLE